jgi:hypothetical protein
MTQLREVERIYKQSRGAARRRTSFTLRWEFNRVARLAAGSTDASLLARLAALRDEMIFRGLALPT